MLTSAKFRKFFFEKIYIPIDQLCAKFQYLELGELSQSWDIQKINFANVIIFKFFLNILISVIKTIFKQHFQNSMFYNASKNVWLCRIKLFQCCFLYLVQIYWKLVLGKKIFKSKKFITWRNWTKSKLFFAVFWIIVMSITPEKWCNQLKIWYRVKYYDIKQDSIQRNVLT